jgi:hypothetical protein
LRRVFLVVVLTMVMVERRIDVEVVEEGFG